MTHRERLEAKLAKREEWAAGRASKAAAAFAYGDKYRGDVAFNTQPGHIPERARVIRKTEQGFEHSQMAAHHESKADGIARQLDRSIYDDDADAGAALAARIVERETKLQRMKLVNKLYKKGDAVGLAALGLTLERLQATLTQPGHWDKKPFASYEITNLAANIRRDRERLKVVAARRERAAAAEASANGVSIEGTDYVRVTFADKPEREVLDALKAAGFHWKKGSWYGYRAKLPPSVA